MMVEDSMVDCAIMQKVSLPDGEGGFYVEWVEGVHFEAAITFDSSMQARTAEKLGVTSLYTVTTRKNAMLDYHDVFKRVKDGKIFRVTTDGDDVQTPPIASFQYRQVTAEEWKLS